MWNSVLISLLIYKCFVDTVHEVVLLCLYCYWCSKWVVKYIRNLSLRQFPKGRFKCALSYNITTHHVILYYDTQNCILLYCVISYYIIYLYNGFESYRLFSSCFLFCRIALYHILHVVGWHTLLCFIISASDKC